MAPAAGLGCCQPPVVEWHPRRSGAGSAVLRELAGQGIADVWACCFKESAPPERLIRGMGFEFMPAGRYAAPNDREYESLEFRITL